MAGFFHPAKEPRLGKGPTVRTTNILERVIARYGNGPRFIARRCFDMNPKVEPNDPRLAAMPDVHGHAKGEHKPFAEERPIPYTARMLFLWFYHAARRGAPRFMMVADHVNFLTFEDPAAVNLVRRALKLAAAGDLYGAAESAGVEVGHAAVVSEGLRQGMRFVIGAELDNDPRSRPDAQNIVDAMKPDGLVRSVHFLTIDHAEHGAGWQWPFDNPEFAGVYETLGTERVWELYEAALLDAIEKQPGHIVGHIYVPAKFGHWPSAAALETFEDKLIAACAERGMAIEINTRYLYHNPDDEAGRQRYLEAYRRLLRKAKDGNVLVAVSSDAHSPKDQGAAFETALALLDEVEINELAFPIAGRIARVALRAPREEPPPPPPPEPDPVVVAPTEKSAPKRAAASRSATRGTAARPAAARETKRPSRPARPPAPAPAPEVESEPAAVRVHKSPARPSREHPKAPNAKAAPPSPPAKAKETAKPAPRASTAKTAPRKAVSAKPPAKPAPAKTTTPKAATPKRSTAKPVAKAPARALKPALKPAPKPAPKPARSAKKAAAPARKAQPARKASPAKKKAAKPVKKAAPKRAAPARKAVAKKAPAKKKPTRSRR